MCIRDSDQIVPLSVAPGYQLTIELAPDERVENVAVGDAGAWQVTPNKRGDHVFVKAVQTGVTSNMTIVTDARTYVFDLRPLYGPTPDMAFRLRFRYPSEGADQPVALVPSPGRYRFSGDKALRPASMADDGRQTRISWAAGQVLPAMFIIDRNNKERAIDGAMREGVFVIDDVANRLIFRLDKKSAQAVRVAVDKDN
jgi:type IV secretion system protein VirB9